MRRLTVEIREVRILDVGTRSEVDQLECHRLEVHQDVLVLPRIIHRARQASEVFMGIEISTDVYLDVPVEHARSVALKDGLNHLAEKVASHGLGQGSALRDEIEKVLTGFHPLHDNDEDVTRIAGVQEPNDAPAMRHLAK